MIALTDHLAKPGRTILAGVPEGYDALLLGEAAGNRLLLHVCRDDSRLAALRAALAFFAPQVQILAIPAWDCLPYDRVSPNAEIVAHRLDTLTRLATAAPATGLVLTTASAILQRLPPRNLLAASRLAGRPGDRLARDAFEGYFTRNGYRRAATVREPGEYAFRGGIVDIFPPGSEEPLRLDFFGDELESVRCFDPMTQRTTGRRDGFVLRPMSEVLLDEDAIRLFRERYRRMFGAPGDDDPLYAAVSAGRRHPGMEHWLPLFHERLETLFDYLPEAAVSFDHDLDDVVRERFDMIAEHYAARREILDRPRTDAPKEELLLYKPIPPKLLYLDAKEWDEHLDSRPVVVFSPFEAPEGGTGSVIDAGGRRAPDFAVARRRSDINLFDEVRNRLRDESERRLLIFGHGPGSRDRLGALLRDHGVEDLATVENWPEALNHPPGRPLLAVLDIEHGFVCRSCLAFSEQDILGERIMRPPRGRRRAEQFIAEISSLETGDLVVHVEHGIGRYEGLETLEVMGAPHDCLALRYAGGDRLYVPVENLDVLSRYGPETSEVQLDRLGAPAWQARKARVKRRIREIAESLLRTAAERTLRKGDPMVPPEGAYEEFCASFSWAETEDQLRAIEDVLADLASGRPMDRLICGDVGFGKTEVALRAAFVAAMAGYQVAVVVPTTLLADQHYRTFRDRFAGLPVRIEQLSRLVTGHAASAIKSGIANGSVGIVIGTHKLLAKDISFANLGLLVIDEEQHFGVAQKERLKQLRANVHVLTLTATPIPRTLQMALAGVREMSVIASPPVDRLAVRTFVLPYDPVVIREALLRERHRGGQTFYVCPRISDLGPIEERLTRLVPDLRIAVAHGRMPTRKLEDVMAAFCEGRYDVLLCTQIVEAGLDIPTANTLVVHRADRFGLAQLYQLRGRVGRAKTRAYAYLTLPPGQTLTESAKRRLEVMQALDTLGAGFALASHDLDIRGAGNLLGEEQSGHIREVGVELYQSMLEETVAALREGHGETEESWTPQIALGTSVLIPETYVPDLGVRLGLYRRLSLLVDPGEIEGFAAELVDRFGPLPEEVENLLQIIRIKRLCRTAGVDRIDAGPKGATLSFHNQSPPNPEALIAFIQSKAGSVRLRPDQSLVFIESWQSPQKRIAGVRRLMEELAGLAGGAADAQGKTSVPCDA